MLLDTFYNWSMTAMIDQFVQPPSTKEGKLCKILQEALIGSSICGHEPHPYMQARMRGACPLEAPALMLCLIWPPPLSQMSFSRLTLPCSAAQSKARYYTGAVWPYQQRPEACSEIKTQTRVKTKQWSACSPPAAAMSAFRTPKVFNQAAGLAVIICES